MLQGDGYEYPAVALRVAFASGIAFILAQFFDIAVFNKLRSAAWWKAPLISSFLASLIDTTIFLQLHFLLKYHSSQRQQMTRFPGHGK